MGIYRAIQAATGTQLHTAALSGSGVGRLALQPPRTAVPGPYQVTVTAGTRYAAAYLAGASYTYGETGAPGLSTVQVLNNERGVNTTTPGSPQTAALIPLVAHDGGGGSVTESLLEGMANRWARRWSPTYTAGVIVHHRAQGGTGTSTYTSAGGAPFANSMDQVADVVTAAAPDSVEYVMLLEGSATWFDETAGGSRADSTPVTPWATTEANLRAILASWRAGLTTRTGQTYQPPMLLPQLGWWQLGGTPIAAGHALQILNLVLTDPDFVGSGPLYPAAVGPDSIHLTNEGYRWAALVHGEVVARCAVDGEDFEPVHADTAVAVGSTIELTYSAPQGISALELDTSNYAWRNPPASATSHGFRYIPNLGPARAITGVAVNGLLVTVTLDGAAEVGATIGYADFGAQPSDSTAMSPTLTGPGGNLRSTLVDTSAEGVPLFFFASTQQLTIT